MWPQRVSYCNSQLLGVSLLRVVPSLPQSRGWDRAGTPPGSGQGALLAANPSVCPEHGRQALRDEQTKYPVGPR